MLYYVYIIYDGRGRAAGGAVSEFWSQSFGLRFLVSDFWSQIFGLRILVSTHPGGMIHHPPRGFDLPSSPPPLFTSLHFAISEDGLAFYKKISKHRSCLEPCKVT